MDLQIKFEDITRIFHQAIEDGRQTLYEYETYELLRKSGAESPPLANYLIKGTRPSNEELTAIPGEKLVLKIVSPTIIHKTEVKGVKVIEKHPGKIRSTWRRMMDEVPVRYTKWIEEHKNMSPKVYEGLTGEALFKAISADIKGVLCCQYMPPDSSAFGNELIVSIRRTREFGMVITAGLGGTDTELFAQRFKKGQAVVSASTVLTDGETFFELFKQTIAYKKLSGQSRGQSRIVSDDQLIECFTSFIIIANYYSPLNDTAPYVIEELEVNPFAFTDYQMVPLDGMCRFSMPEKLSSPRPVEKIDNLLHPKTIAIIGVSASKMNFGRIILNNILSCGFNKEQITIIRPETEEIDGVKCIPSLSGLNEKADLFVVAINAVQVPDLIDEVIDLDAANSVMLIPGGLGEKKGSEARAQLVMDKINTAHKRKDGGPIFIGGNCLGVVSHPGNYDTIFIPEEKLPKQRGSNKRIAAFVSQSGAFVITRTSKLPILDPAYILSIGNQNDLTSGDIVSFLESLDDIKVIAIYMEGFNDLDGLLLCQAIKAAVKKGKQVVFYKAGRTPEGKNATSGHTASVAGDYMVCESCVHQAGAMVADNFTQFEDLFALAVRMHDKKVSGNRLAAISGAGFEAVGMADNIQGDDYHMKMAIFSDNSVEKLETIIKENRLDSLVDVKNPMDINPGANDTLHAEIAKILNADGNVDGIVIGLDPLSPAMNTLPDSTKKGEAFSSKSGIVKLMTDLNKTLDKPVLGVVDAGDLYDPMVTALEEGGLPVFRSSDRAVEALAKYINGRLHAAEIRQKN
jgi:acyl-CoA synthetase (NDP forming)